MSNTTMLTTENGGGMGNITLLLNPGLCTTDTCDLTLAAFTYLPTLAGNAIFAAIFGIFLVWQIVLGIKHKTWGYMVCMLFGLVLEILGYVGRVLLHGNPFNNDYFLLYLICLTIAPAFMTASIYLCLGRIVTVYGTNLSRFQPRTYTIVFCTFDLICLILQAVGGAIASLADTPSQGDLGRNIMLAGLVAQIVALVVFSIAAGEFALRVWKGKGAWNQKYISIVSSKLFKGFLFGLLVAVVTILVRSIYRCVELSGGFDSELFVGHEGIYMVFEGVMIIIACSCLSILHPGVCFKGAWNDANFSFRGNSKGIGSKDRMSSDTESGFVQNVEMNVRK